MLTGQEDEPPRLISWIYLYQHFSPQGFGGKYAGQAVKNIHGSNLGFHQREVWSLDRIAIGNHDIGLRDGMRVRE